MAAVDAASTPPSSGSGNTGDVVVYFSVGRRCGDSVGKLETALFRRDASGDEVKDLFRSAAEAGPRDIVKLWDADGRLLNICPRLVGNTPATRYSLEVVAAHCNGMLLDELGVDLRTLEDRVAQLERRLRGEVDELPSSVVDLKRQVDHFREKLETTEHLSWLGFHNDFPESLTAVASNRRLQYRRKSSTEKKRVREKFFSICDLAVSEETRQAIRRPSFDSCQWEDEEVLVLLQQMFVDLDLPARFGIDLVVLRNFLAEVYDHYNEVPFHNFRHCFCVAQMMYAMIWCVDLPGKIGHQETLILLTACICHDLDHPGYNNIYQINAGTELALRYNDISPLENHHCSVAFRLLARPECNFLGSLPRADFRAVREGIIRCVLATDMARHNEILEQFCEVAVDFDYRNRAHVNLLEMVLIKVADISNEARPMDVAEPWLDRLLQEFFKQSDAEKLEGLPVTPFMDRDKITKPSSQVGFIGLVLLPLFEALGELFSELQELIVVPVREALEHYRRLHDAERMHRKSVAEGVAMLDGAHLAKALSVASRRSLDEPDDGASSDDGVEADDDDDDEGPGTEVEHSEKALTFKISTDAGRRSMPNSRKGSRDTELRVSRVASPASDSDDATGDFYRCQSDELRRALEDPSSRDRGSRLKDMQKLGSLEEGKEATDLRRPPGKKVRVRDPPDDADVACSPRDVAVEERRATDAKCDETDELERLKEEAKAIDNLQRSLGGLRPAAQPAEETLSPAADGAEVASPDKKKSLSLLRRFRHLAERLPFGANPGDAGSGSVSENSTPKRSRPTLEPRAATLPKPRRRWRALIGRSAASPDVDAAGASRLSGSLDSALDVEKENNNRRKPARWMSSLAASLRPRK